MQKVITTPNPDAINFWKYLVKNGFDITEHHLESGHVIAQYSGGKYSGMIEFGNFTEPSMPNKAYIRIISGEDLYSLFKSGHIFLLGIEVSGTKTEKIVVLSGYDEYPFDHYRLLFCRDGHWELHGVCGIHREVLLKSNFKLARTILGENFLDVYWERIGNNYGK